MSISVIGFDCDDTLWRNEEIFLKTRSWFHQRMAEYAPVEVVSDALYQTELKNLSYFGYGVKGFTLSMIETAVNLSEGSLPTANVPIIIDEARKMLDEPVELLPGVEQVLKDLQGDYRLVAITKGDLMDQERKIRQSGLEDFFEDIEIVTEKRPETYQQILAHQNIDVSNFMMVGNSPKSDILPVLDIGGYATYIPYETTWAHEVVDLARLDQPKFNQIDRMSGLLSILRDLEL